MGAHVLRHLHAPSAVSDILEGSLLMTGKRDATVNVNVFTHISELLKCIYEVFGVCRLAMAPFVDWKCSITISAMNDAGITLTLHNSVSFISQLLS